MRALVTGSEGFIGKHLCSELTENGYEVIRCDINGQADVRVDITDMGSVTAVLDRYRPEVLINLAGQANVGLSWKQPQRTVLLNTVGFINVLEAVREIGGGVRVIAMGSSDEYGQLRERGGNVTEDTPLSPMNPYSISKQTQEQFAQLYVKNYGLDVCTVRQFNLAGAGQPQGFMVADFAFGIAAVEAGRQEYVSVGNLESARDFTHVRDACRALRLTAEKGRTGEVYNICSGRAYKAAEILDKLRALASVPIEVREDPSRMRPSDTPVICGSHDKLTADTGWEPRLGIDDIVADALGYWRGIV